MASERQVVVRRPSTDVVLHPRPVTCACGQELDTCVRRHCPRCGSSLTPHAA